MTSATNEIGSNRPSQIGTTTMTDEPRRTRAPRRRGARRTMVAATATLLATGACDGLLDVDIPGSVQEDDLTNPALAGTLYNSALGSFECAYTNYVATVGVLTEEYIVSAAWLNSNIWGWRGVELDAADGNCSNNRNNSAFGAYTPLQEARYLLEDAAQRIEDFEASDVPDQDAMLTVLSAYTGYTYALLGEGFCEMAVDQGPLMQPAEVLAVAETYFTDAIDRNDASDDIRLMATLGRARVRLDQGDAQGAAQDAAQIPEGWRYTADYSSIQGNRENRLYNVTIRNLFLSVASEYRGLEAGGQPDPRVVVEDGGVFGHDGTTPHWYQRKYMTADAPMPIASWQEAKLILAEALGGNDAVQHINELRATQDIPPLENPPLANMLPVIIEERRRQLFSEGHRLNDMLRHDIAFPGGTNHKGQTYGPTTCLPLPDQERNANPNL